MSLCGVSIKTDVLAGSPRKRSLIKQPKHLRSASTTSLSSLDDPDINAGEATPT